MKKITLLAGLFILMGCQATADVSVAILKGAAVGEKEAGLSVSALDEAGRPIKDLTKDNFRLLVGGEEINDFSVEPASTTDEPLSIVLGLDVSGSMWGEPFRETQKAISVLLDQLEKRDFVSLLSFGSQVRAVTEFTRERYTIRSQVDALKPVDDWTHLYDATYEAIRIGKDAPTARAAVILLTDGRDEGSGHLRTEAVNMAMGGSIPVFVIGFGESIDSEYLREIAGVSGGDFVSTPDVTRIPHLYGQVLDQLKNQYMIQFDFAREPSTYKASLTLLHGSKTARTTKEFLFNPAGGPIVISPPPPGVQAETPVKPWHVSMTNQQLMTLGLGILGFAVLLIALLTFVYFKVRRRRVKREMMEKAERDDRDKRLLEMLENKGTEECELEYPSGHHTAVQPLDTRVGQMTRLSHTSPDVLLQVDSMKRSVPLVHEGVDVLEELIIAKRSKDRDVHRKKNSVYLWTRNDFVSRATAERVGHARIFIGKGERFMVEDLGSTNGTWIGGKKIDSIFPLQDGDVLDIGGKEGLRILYKEGNREISDLERTMIFK